MKTKMKVILNEKYKITLQVNNQVLTFTGVINNVDDAFLYFTDKYGKDFIYGLNTIISLEAVQ